MILIDRVVKVLEASPFVDLAPSHLVQVATDVAMIVSAAVTVELQRLQAVDPAELGYTLQYVAGWDAALHAVAEKING